MHGPLIIMSSHQQQKDFMRDAFPVSEHQRMMEDDVKWRAYECAIGAAVEGHGKTVLDVGAGLGALTLMAAAAGARRVYAVEVNPIIADKLRRIVADNEALGTIRKGVVVVITGDIASLEELHAGVERNSIDVLVSDWMGHMLWYENIWPAVCVARERWLKPDTGVMLPCAATLKMAGLSAESAAYDKIVNLLGVDGSPFRGRFSFAALHDDIMSAVHPFADIEVKDLVTKEVVVVEFDLRTAAADAGTVVVPAFALPLKSLPKIERAGAAAAFVLSFEVSFPNGCKLDAGVTSEMGGTHWGQCVVALDEYASPVKNKLQGSLRVETAEGGRMTLRIAYTAQDGAACEVVRVLAHGQW